MDEIEATRIKIKNRVDKLKEEITSLSMTKKKLIGVDYLKNEYYVNLLSYLVFQRLQYKTFSKDQK